MRTMLPVNKHSAIGRSCPTRDEALDRSENLSAMLEHGTAANTKRPSERLGANIAQRQYLTVVFAPMP